MLFHAETVSPSLCSAALCFIIVQIMEPTYNDLDYKNALLLGQMSKSPEFLQYTWNSATPKLCFIHNEVLCHLDHLSLCFSLGLQDMMV